MTLLAGHVFLKSLVFAKQLFVLCGRLFRWGDDHTSVNSLAAPEF